MDADVDYSTVKNLHSIVLLPGTLPPDQLIFEYLYNLAADHSIWRNPQQFTRSFLTQIASPLINRLSIPAGRINLKELVIKDRITNAGAKNKLRELFKDFYKASEFQAFLGQKKAENNPWRCWARDSKSQCDDFISRFVNQLSKTMSDGHHVDKSKLTILNGKRGANSAAT